jgi:hypothetical protein
LTHLLFSSFLNLSLPSLPSPFILFVLHAVVLSMLFPLRFRLEPLSYLICVSYRPRSSIFFHQACLIHTNKSRCKIGLGAFRSFISLWSCLYGLLYNARNIWTI